MAQKRRVLVIGAGASGLAAIKSCKEESLNVTCYEKAKNFGGRWHYSEQGTSVSVPIMKSTICISSKEMTAYSDFPPPNDFPNFLHHTKMLEYLKLYAQQFDLISHIRYQTEVIRLIPSNEYEKNGKWLVTSLYRFNNSEVTEEFDCVIVCTGRLSEPVIPSYDNQNSFHGSILHSHSLKSATVFEGLKILVVGSGNSAIEAAVDISAFAQQVYLSTRRGFWLFPKLGPKGLPYDSHILRRDLHFLKNLCKDCVSSYIERYLETKINHEACKIKPSHRALDSSPTVNDDLPDKILTGRVIVKGNISTFQKNGVTFEHEDSETEIDCVIFATGYTTILPFVEKEFYLTSSGSSSLYKYVFPIGMKHPTLAFVGLVKSNGPQIPLSESQSRWVARLFSKNLQLPSKESMEQYIVSKNPTTENFGETTVDYIDYMDELAEEYGAKPNICSLLFKDSKLFWACFTGPFLSYQYRLVGPNKMANARDLILDCEQRIREAFNTKNASKNT